MPTVVADLVVVVVVAVAAAAGNDDDGVPKLKPLPGCIGEDVDVDKVERADGADVVVAVADAEPNPKLGLTLPVLDAAPNPN